VVKQAFSCWLSREAADRVQLSRETWMTLKNWDGWLTLPDGVMHDIPSPSGHAIRRQENVLGGLFTSDSFSELAALLPMSCKALSSLVADVKPSRKPLQPHTFETSPDTFQVHDAIRKKLLLCTQRHFKASFQADRARRLGGVRYLQLAKRTSSLVPGMTKVYRSYIFIMSCLDSGVPRP
jgi:hypothetical protein